MTEPGSGRDFPYAGFWSRAAARVIDLLLLLAAFNLFYLLDRHGADAGLWAEGGLGEGFSGEGFSAVNVLRLVFFLGFPVFYYVYLHGAYGQTFGKMAMRIRVLNEDGTPIDFRKALFRWLGYFWAAFDARKQGLHDRVCKTIVVREPYGGTGGGA